MNGPDTRKNEDQARLQKTTAVRHTQVHFRINGNVAGQLNFHRTPIINRFLNVLLLQLGQELARLFQMFVAGGD